jgi:hypothetical protein
MSDLERAQDVEDSANGEGAYAGTDGLSLLEDFYNTGNDDIFNNWIGDALTDHEALDMRILKNALVMIEMRKRHLSAQGARGSFERMLESQHKLSENYRELGKLVFDLVNGYMVEAHEAVNRQQTALPA